MNDIYNMNDNYNKILQKVNNFCNSVPEKGFEILYLQNASVILELYQEAGVVLDEYEDKNPEFMNGSLKEILHKLEEIVN